MESHTILTKRMALRRGSDLRRSRSRMLLPLILVPMLHRRCLLMVEKVLMSQQPKASRQIMSLLKVNLSLSPSPTFFKACQRVGWRKRRIPERFITVIPMDAPNGNVPSRKKQQAMNHQSSRALGLRMTLFMSRRSPRSKARIPHLQSQPMTRNYQLRGKCSTPPKEKSIILTLTPAKLAGRNLRSRRPWSITAPLLPPLPPLRYPPPYRHQSSFDQGQRTSLLPLDLVGSCP
mmetsp:Transcript_7176/g.20008  ORF Transcript_7176/g.20008 Transcript_7176/m.20008 type:complete len:233 (-) Transcript_7176:1317-2015(-)